MGILMGVWFYTSVIWPPVFLYSFAVMLKKHRENTNWVPAFIVASISLFMLLSPIYAFVMTR